MEKKMNRCLQSSLKGLANDSKKSQDVSSGKLWPRNGRRKDPTNINPPIKSESTNRKSFQQRTKTFDKRPKSRSFQHGNPSGGNEVTGLGAYEQPELGSVFVQGSKKQSLNHLLNFQYPSRDVKQFRVGQYTKPGHHWLSTSKHKYNKEHFVQANCQFIVNSSGDYKQYMNNPDTLVDWSLIEQVNLQVHELPSCPICLYPPVAAKITRCGHIYCWSCVLHYLALSEKTWHKCPICYESVHRQDLKSVVFVPHMAFNVNDTITFKLMKRARGSLTSYPIDDVLLENDHLYNMYDDIAPRIYCKLLLANKNNIMAIIEREKQELQKQLLEEESDSESYYIEEAIRFLSERENVLINMELSIASPVSDNLLEMDTLQLKAHIDHLDICNNFDSTNNYGQAKKYFYFYQALDGQHIYLDPMNVKMLEHTYGSLEHSPKQISGNIIEKRGASVTEEIRNKYRYMQHLPITCQFEIIEIKLQVPLISKDTEEAFTVELEKRKKKRQRRYRDEKRREKRISEVEDRKMGKYPTAEIELESHSEFPDFHVENNRERTISDETVTDKSEIYQDTSDSLSSNISAHFCEKSNDESKGEQDKSGCSFAEMLSKTPEKRGKWPTLHSAPSSISTIRLINATGPKLKVTGVPKHSDGEEENEDYIPVPQYNQSFREAIAIALENVPGPSRIADEKPGRKKKKKQKFLFRTGMAYSSNN